MVICLIFGAYGLKCFLGSEITGFITSSRMYILACLVLAMASSIMGACKAVDLNIHLDGCDTVLCTAYLKVHIAEEVFQTLDIR